MFISVSGTVDSSDISVNSGSSKLVLFMNPTEISSSSYDDILSEINRL